MGEIQADVQWKDGLSFIGQTGFGYEMVFDGDHDTVAEGFASSPKEVFLAALIASTAIDVARHLSEHGQPVKEFQVKAMADEKAEEPRAFARVRLTYAVTGEVDAEVFVKAVELSQTRGCALSAMLHPSVKFEATMLLNGQPLADLALAE